MRKVAQPGACALVVACLAAASIPAQGQVADDAVLLNPELRVTEPRIVAESPSETQVPLAPAEGQSLGAWPTLNASVANLHLSDGGAGSYGSLLALRGLSNTAYFSEPAVTLYFGDIPLPAGFTYPSGFWGLGSVAVLPGPQGVRFGRATDGGVLLFTPAGEAPHAGGEWSAGAGSYAASQAILEAHTASSGALGAQACFEADTRSGYVSNQQTGGRVDDQADENAFVRLRLSPSSRNQFSLEILQSRSRDGAEPLVPLGGPYYAVRRPADGVTDLDAVGAALKGVVALAGGACVSTVTSYTDWRMNPYQDLLVLPPPLENRVLQSQKSWNEEVHLEGDPAAPLRLRTGLWLSRQTTQNFVDRSLPGRFPIEESGFEQGSWSAALFGDVAFAPAGPWSFDAGIRAEDDSKQFNRVEKAPDAGLAYEGRSLNRALLPRIAADRQLSQDSRLEASASLGMRPGGFASYTDNPDLIPFQAERVDTIESGWTLNPSNNPLALTVSGFYTAVRELQVERSFSAADYFVATARRAHSAGVEMKARWRPTEHLVATLDAGLDQARLDAFTAPLSGSSESGNPVPGVPRLNAGFEAAYRGDAGWFAAVGATEVGPTRYDELATPKYTQAAYTLLDMRVGIDLGHWTLAVTGANLGGTRYFALIVPGVNSGAPGAPRTFGTQAVLRF